METGIKKAIAVLSAGIKKNEDGKWESSSLFESDDFQGGLGGQERIIAANVLYKQSPRPVITTGGRGGDKNIANVEHPDISSIVKDELTALGVKEEDIIEENKSNKTFDSLVAIREIIKNNHFSGISIISNDYHLPRVRVMMEIDSELNNLLQKEIIQLVAAEEILIEHEPGKWKNYFKKAYQSEAMKKIITLEKRGIEQIKEGKYKFK